MIGAQSDSCLPRHAAVLKQECIDGLNIKKNDAVYVDGTFGYGGHTSEILKRLDSGRVIAIDRDESAIRDTGGLPPGFEDRVIFAHGNFRDVSRILDSLGVGLVDGMLFDLGVSSMQLDDSERGFSYSRDAALDMRMDRSEELTAYDVVNSWPEDELRRAFYEYGEERYARLIARAIVRKRAEAPIRTTFDLNAVIFSAIPAAARRESQHPSKRCYQAVRTVVNDELGAIKRMLDSAPERLKSGGRLCVISFQSLEDRLVKSSFAALAKGCVCPKDFPVCVCGVAPVLKVITAKPVYPSDTEVEMNPRARSARLRIAERL